MFWCSHTYYQVIPNNITIRISKELAGLCSGLNSTGNK